MEIAILIVVLFLLVIELPTSVFHGKSGTLGTSHAFQLGCSSQKMHDPYKRDIGGKANEQAFQRYQILCWG